MKKKAANFIIVFFMCCLAANAQSDLQNGDFEQWRLKEFAKCCGRNTDIPWYWGVAEQLTGLNYNKFVFLENGTGLVHSGSSSVQLYSDTTYLNNLILIPGIIAYGEMTDSASTDITIGPVIKSTGLPLPYNSNPISLNFFMLMQHVETDTPYYMYVFTKWDSVNNTEDTLAYRQVDIPDDIENMNRWVGYTDTIHYTSSVVADTVRILFFGGRFGNASLQGNSTILDDVTLNYPTTGLVSLDGKAVLQVFPNPVSNVLTVITGQYQAGNSFQIFDEAGKSIKAVPVESESTSVNISSLGAGEYFYRLAGKGNAMLSEGKFVVTR